MTTLGFTRINAGGGPSCTARTGAGDPRQLQSNKGKRVTQNPWAYGRGNPVPGALLLVLELAFFAFPSWALYQSGFTKAAWTLGLIAAVHYLASYDRILWLIRR